jgi:hypothetical protein
MMRLNATIPALLAFAVLYFFPVDSLAMTPHHSAHKSTPSHKKHSATRRGSTAASPTPTRHTISSPNPAANARAKSELAGSAARKATSEDFLKAAAGEPEPMAPSTSHTRSSEEPHKKAQARSSTRKLAPVSKPIPVVNIAHKARFRPTFASVEEAASTPVILPELYNKRGRLLVPPPLRGSHEILVHQNQVADRDGLDRIQSDEDLLDMRGQRLLVSIPSSNALQIDDRLPTNRRFCRPWTAQFLTALARAHYAHFHTPLQINSAVRTVEFQQHLIHINGNAAPAEGDTASPHLTGQAIDIAKHGLSLTEIAWLRGYLLPLVQEGKVDVEEEFQQACFHVSVYKRYLPSAADPGRNLETPRHTATTALATAIR